MNIEGGDEEDSPYTTGGLYWETTISIDAVMDGREHESYIRRLEKWTKGSGGSFLSSSKSTTSKLDHYSFGTAMNHTAVLWREFDVTFQNNLPGASGGVITVDGSTSSAPITGHVIEVLDPSITAAGPYQVINGIEYTFGSWSSGSSPFTPDDHTTYTANYSAKPLPPANVSAGGAVDNPVEITWTEHPNDSVTQYQIWRKIKPLGQGEGSPELLTTVNRGTTSCIDYGCIVTESYTEDLVSYDVRSYYSVNSSYSDPSYVPVYADSNPARIAKDEEKIKLNAFSELPTTFAVSSFPNPFNPSTTITYQLVEESNIFLQIFDVIGREVVSLVNDRKNAGYHSIPWHGKDSRGINVASGTYFYRFTASPISGSEPFIRSGKLLLTK